MNQLWFLTLLGLNISLLAMTEVFDPLQRGQEIMEALKVHLNSLTGSVDTTARFIQEFQQLKRKTPGKFTREFYQDLLFGELSIMSGFVQNHSQLCELLAAHKIRTGSGITPEEIAVFDNASANKELIDNFIKHIKDLAR